MKPFLLILITSLLACNAPAAEPSADPATPEALMKALAETIEKDGRHPSPTDLSGAWTSGPNLVGYTMQLEQRGETVEGRGYYWGCLGMFNPFRVVGSSKSGTLSLTFTFSTQKHEKRVFKYSLEKGQIQFSRKGEGPRERIVPYWNMREF